MDHQVVGVHLALAAPHSTCSHYVFHVYFTTIKVVGLLIFCLHATVGGGEVMCSYKVMGSYNGAFQLSI